MNRAIIEMVVPGAIICGEAIARFFPAVGEFIGNHNILVSSVLGCGGFVWLACFVGSFMPGILWPKDLVKM